MRVSAEIAELVAATRTQVVLLLQQQKQQQRELQAQLDESRQQLAMEQAKLQQAQREIQAKDRQIVSLIRKEQKSPSANSGVDLLQGQHDFSANVLDA
jgi:Tfp pilus assembly protein FimV